MSSNENGFKIQRLNNSVWTQVGTTATNVTSWANGGLSASTTYTYRVLAYNATGDSPASNQASATTQALSVPSAPAAGGATSVTSSSFTANWSSVSGASGYQLDVSSNSAFTSYLSGYQSLNVGNVVNRSVSGLNASTTYYYRVRAINANGTSGNSNIVSVTTTAASDTTAPTVPTGLTPTAASSSQINLSWNASTDSGGSGLAGYRVYQSGIQTATTATTSYSRTGLSANTQYCFTVAAYDNAGNVSGQSVQACATTQAISSSWSKAMGSVSDDRLNAMVVDNGGNLITTGYYTGTVDFAGGGGDINSIHSSIPYLGNYTKDIFVAKYDSAGRHMWSKSFGNDGNSEMGQAVALDATGNIYVAGKTGNGINVRFIDFGCPNSDYQGSGLNSFVAKLNSQGQCQWVRYVSDNFDDVSTGLAVDTLGNVYVTGYFQSNANFDGQDPIFGSTTFRRIATGTINGQASSSDGYLVKYNSNGATQWVRRFGGSSIDQGTSVAIDGTDGGVVLTGTFYGTTANFEDSDGASKLPLTNSGDRDGLVVKYSSSGQLLWAIPAATAGADTLSAAKVDSSGNVWVTGLLNNQIYIGKYLGSNRQLAWPAKFFSAGSVGSGNSISLDSNGTATIGGYISATVDFGGGALAPQQADTFAVQYSASGAYVAGSAKLYGGAGYQAGMVAVSGTGVRILAGYFPDFATFGGNSYTSAGSSDIFICKP